MKILIVNGFANGSHERYLHFKQLVMHALRSIAKLDVTGITIVYIFELHTGNADPAAITHFDGLDFVFLDGDCTIPPWHPGYKKCLFGANFAASVLAYLCSTGGEMIHALNGNGRGAPLKNVQSMPAPVDDDFQPHAVVLDSDTGDYYAYNAGRLEWEPKGMFCGWYTVVVDSPRGPLLIEFGNALCAHFSISNEYPETATILENFVVSKFDQIKLHEHVDRSYMSSVSGMLSSSGGAGPPKHIASLSANFEPPVPPPRLDSTTHGKTSPKKCRPLSAASSTVKAKPRPHSATPTMVAKLGQVNRLRTDNNTTDNQTERTDGSPEKKHDPATPIPPVANNHPSGDMKFMPPKAKASTIKVCRVGDPHKPYCAYQRFQKMEKTAALGGTYYSVVNDAPYVGTFEKHVVEGEDDMKKAGTSYRPATTPSPRKDRSREATSVLPNLKFNIAHASIQKEINILLNVDPTTDETFQTTL
ncbi:hypothetical protein DYB31_000817 [Aphanomyces astaci]|uniref:Uncharacterized protein n=1 Tax=Aphanomyces astaci TaxID=112090 RepID=A0A397F5Y7_APHAT|nr:hypothetical protein DYB31_000817 [Aphanomyces astaci]